MGTVHRATVVVVVSFLRSTATVLFCFFEVIAVSFLFRSSFNAMLHRCFVMAWHGLCMFCLEKSGNSILKYPRACLQINLVKKKIN